LEKQNGFNLIGNPYASAISADAFLTNNTSNILRTLYFWTHNTPITNNKYTSDDYAAYNLLGGIGTRGAVSLGINESIPDGTIASGQAFFVISKNSEIAEFNNSMRIFGRNSAFFKQAKTKENIVEKHRIWLNLKNTEGVFKQILLGYSNGATNLYDENYDAESLNGNQFVDFYSIIDNKKLVIQGRGLPFEETDSISLGFSSTIDGEFNISIDHDDGLFSDVNVFIEDKDLKIKHDLKESTYPFSTKRGTFNDRFEINFISKNLKTDNHELELDEISVFVNNNTILIDAAKNNIKEITIFDISGKQIYRKTAISNFKFLIENLPFKNQILLVKIVLENGQHSTHKILI